MEEMLTMVPCAHAGKYRLDHGNWAEEVGSKQLIDLRVFALFPGSAVPMASVVDENVDAPEAGLGPPHRVGNLSAVAHVQRDRQRGGRVGICEVLDSEHVAGGDDCVPTPLEHSLSQVSTESGRASRDQPRRHRISYHLFACTLPSADSRTIEVTGEALRRNPVTGRFLSFTGSSDGSGMT